jgi:hypothetical protein
MFHRWLKDQSYTPVDLTGAYAGYPLFIIGGNPILDETRPVLHKLSGSGLPTLALNNVLYTYPKPTMWLTADKPVCYAGQFFTRPGIIKFAYMAHRDEIVEATGKTVKEHPMMLFYTSTFECRNMDTFFSEEKAFGWWRSVFPIALQVAWRLGCRRVYLVGCSFDTQGPRHYPWAAKLTDEQVQWSQTTYNQDLRRLQQLKPMLKERNFRIISCTPNSKANKLLPTMFLSRAIQREIRVAAVNPTLPSELKHSSETK